VGNFVCQIDGGICHTNSAGLRAIFHACCRCHEIFFGIRRVCSQDSPCPPESSLRDWGVRLAVQGCIAPVTTPQCSLPFWGPAVRQRSAAAPLCSSPQPDHGLTVYEPRFLVAGLLRLTLRSRFPSQETFHGEGATSTCTCLSTCRGARHDGALWTAVEDKASTEWFRAVRRAFPLSKVEHLLGPERTGPSSLAECGRQDSPR
jgi:hypothetical protein